MPTHHVYVHARMHAMRSEECATNLLPAVGQLLAVVGDVVQVVLGGHVVKSPHFLSEARRLSSLDENVESAD